MEGLEKPAETDIRFLLQRFNLVADTTGGDQDSEHWLKSDDLVALFTNHNKALDHLTSWITKNLMWLQEHHLLPFLQV